jgi:hypothetical protein
MELGGDTKAVLLLAAAMFLWALLLGVWKYRQMATSENSLAHPYVDTAHRAARAHICAQPTARSTDRGAHPHGTW